MIVVVDYGMGNLRSVSKAFERSGFEVAVSSDPERVLRAAKLVVPGVGAFGDAMKELTKRGLVEPILAQIQRGTPYLGICLGYQLLFEQSEEGGGCEGLCVFRGRVVRFPDWLRSKGLKVPQIGWNRVDFVRPSPIFAGLASGTYFYFVHSYYPEPEEAIVAARTVYGVSFASAIHSGNVFATQFHPEKSQAAGLKVIESFGRL